MRKQKGLWAKRVFVICLTLLCVLSAVYDAATANATMINNALGVQTFRVVESQADAGVDANYFPTVSIWATSTTKPSGTKLPRAIPL